MKTYVRLGNRGLALCVAEVTHLVVFLVIKHNFSNTMCAPQEEGSGGIEFAREFFGMRERIGRFFRS